MVGHYTSARGPPRQVPREFPVVVLIGSECNGLNILSVGETSAFLVAMATSPLGYK